MSAVYSPLQAQVVQWQVEPGAAVRAGDLLVILEAMKMEHEVRAAIGGRLGDVFFAAGELVESGALLARIEPLLATVTQPAASATAPTEASSPAPGSLRADLQRTLDRHAPTQDASRPEAVARRHALGLRTARWPSRRSAAAAARKTCSGTPRPTAWSPALAASTAPSSARKRAGPW